ncbi:hypothetical protein [Tunicatimonas pelagia]|uniref:hypothetical protein n=1 Tax=Tunicatimonas pelagia TaxID=931531 RepID=UPI002666DDCE|nr:hypothetical protein [Tunicatimonas pelagia]WKN45539.1 hypothetical protein P0M28_11285 [Tunicatimonas pelagia]
MYIPFEEMPATARIWVYQANRPLSDTEEAQTIQLGEAFANQWAAHGNALRSSVQVVYQYFLVIAVDEQYNAASGCSIDSSVAFVRELEHKFSTENTSISFFDRTQIAFWQDDAVQLLPMNQAKQAVKEGKVLPDTITFDNTVPSIEAWENRWKIPVQNSWLARYLPQTTNA